MAWQIGRTSAAAVRRFTGYPATRIWVGLILFGTGFCEAWEALRDDVINFNPQSHHGIIVLGLFQVLRTLPLFLDSARQFDEADGGEEERSPG